MTASSAFVAAGLAGSAVIVSGGGSGIGKAVALAATAAGAKVTVCGRRASSLAAVAELCGAEVSVADLTIPADVERVVVETIERFGRLDGVVSNAGIMKPGSVLDISDEDWDICLSANLTAPFRLARAAMPHLLRNRGSLVTVSSVASLRAPVGSAAYASSKAGLSMLAHTIAVDFGPLGVRSNVVCPNWVRTEMADREMQEFGEPLGLSIEDSYTEVTRLVPQRRPAEPAEIAAAVVWLLSRESSYVNGATLTVDGGATLLDAGTVAFDFSVTNRSVGSEISSFASK